jgi:hypothetical protein
MFSRERGMSQWLKTRYTSYVDLEYEIRTPLELPVEVIAHLNSKVGTQGPYIQNTPYPSWTAENIIDLAKLRQFLTTYSLTTYWGPAHWNDKSGWGHVLVITPQVLLEVKEILNDQLRVVYQEVHNTPCLIWRMDQAQGTDLAPDDFYSLLNEIRLRLKEYPVIPHLVNEWAPDEDPVYFHYNSVAIAPTANKFDLMRFYQIDGANYGLSTEDIIKEMMLLDRKYGVDFIGPADIQLKRVPNKEELHELESWYGSFCPEGAYQPEFMNDLAKGRIGLGWD